jgi:hypothetical protein
MAFIDSNVTPRRCPVTVSLGGSPSRPCSVDTGFLIRLVTEASRIAPEMDCLMPEI